MILPTDAIASRNDFGIFLNHHKLLNVAVEIGTHLGEWAEQFLKTWHGKRLICVDPWADVEGYHDIIVGRDRQADYERCLERLLPYVGRVELHRLLSQQAAPRFHDETLDFVHIDGNHHPRFVAEDVEIWWPKVVPGGILAGHDLDEFEWGEGITAVVDNFTNRMGLTAYHTRQDNIASWLIFKPL
jgi:hypothetical protein